MNNVLVDYQQRFENQDNVMEVDLCAVDWVEVSSQVDANLAKARPDPNVHDIESELIKGQALRYSVIR